MIAHRRQAKNLKVKIFGGYYNTVEADIDTWLTKNPNHYIHDIRTTSAYPTKIIVTILYLESDATD
jgi:hypothetical protein